MISPREREVLKFVHNANIELFTARLENLKNQNERVLLLGLLADEKVKLSKIK
jgi:hypothetical protein